MAYDYTGTDLIASGSLRDLVQAYDRAITEANELVGRLRELQSKFVTPYIGKQGKYDYLEVYGLPTDSDLDRIPHKIRQMFWRHVIERSGVKNLMDHKRRQELSNQMKDLHLIPPFDYATVHSTLYGWAESSQDVFENMIQTTFKALLPYRHDGYKTNKRYKIGHKLIKYGMSVFGGVSIHNEEMWRDLDRVFCQLDGKRPSERSLDLVATINLADREGTRECETEYFKCKWFKNKNIHLEFKRLDLLQEFNRIGAKQYENVVGEQE